MALTTQTHLGSHYHAGPYADNNALPASSGVYVISTLDTNGRHTIIDVGESNNIRERITNHDRTQQWYRNAVNGVYAWVTLCDEVTRMRLESALRLAYSPVCGVR